MPGGAVIQSTARRSVIGGDSLIAFAGCNYLGLAHDARVLEAARAAADRFGLSTSASRETSGNTTIHEQLERAAFAFIAGDEQREDAKRAAGRDAGRASGQAAGALDCLLVPDGYTANLAAAQGLVKTHKIAVVDARAHASLADAGRCAGMDVKTFRHGDAADLAGVLGELSGPAVVMTDGVFTTDGRIAALGDLLAALRAGDRLLVDDCHGLGVIGPGGRGSCAHGGVDLGSVVLTSTLAKGIGGGGGVVIAERELIGWMRRCAHAYVCTTPVSPLVAAGTLRAIEILELEPERVARLADRARALRSAMRTGEDHLGDDGSGAGGAAVPIAAFPVADEGAGRHIADTLRRAGLYVPVMAYPGGPSPWYLRASVSSEHTRDDLERLAECMGQIR